MRGTEIIEISADTRSDNRPSTSMVGGYNINCYGDSSASINIVTVNNVGIASYLWSDGRHSQQKQYPPNLRSDRDR